MAVTPEPNAALAEALRRVAEAKGRTRPVSVSLPAPLADALQALADAGVVASSSAAVTEALSGWAYNRLLRLTLDELYGEDPSLRPTPEAVRAAADRLGVHLPPAAGEVA